MENKNVPHLGLKVENLVEELELKKEKNYIPYIDCTMFLNPNSLRKLFVFHGDVIQVRRKKFGVFFSKKLEEKRIFMSENIRNNIGVSSGDVVKVEKFSGKLPKIKSINLSIEEEENKEKNDNFEEVLKENQKFLVDYFFRRKFVNNGDFFELTNVGRCKISNLNQTDSCFFGETSKNETKVFIRKFLVSFPEVIIKKKVNLMNLTASNFRALIYTDHIVFIKNKMKSILTLQKKSMDTESFIIYTIEDLKFFDKFTGFDNHHYVMITYRDENDFLETFYMEVRSTKEQIISYFVNKTVLPVIAKTIKSDDYESETKRFYDIVKSNIHCRNSNVSMLSGRIKENFDNVRNINAKKIKRDVKKKVKRVKKGVNRVANQTKDAVENPKKFSSRCLKKVKHEILNKDESESDEDEDSDDGDEDSDDGDYQLLGKKLPKFNSDYREIPLETSAIFGGIGLEVLREKNIMQLNLNYLNSSQGHGYGGEYGGHLKDVFSLTNQSVHWGSSNELGGPDRFAKKIFERKWTPVQSKYCKTSSSFWNSLINHKTKEFKYFYTGKGKISNIKYGRSIPKGAKVKCMKFEVPSDKCEECRKIFAKKIFEDKKLRKTFNIKDRYEAQKFAKKHIFHKNISYKQCENVAKSGNLRNILYDPVNTLIFCTFTGSIALALKFVLTLYEGKDLSEAVALASLSFISTFAGEAALQSFAKLSAKASYENLHKIVRPLTDFTAHNVLGTDFSAKIVNLFRDKNIYGAAALSNLSKVSAEYVTKLLTSSALFGVISLILAQTISTLSDTKDLLTAQISKKQYAKNFTVKMSGNVGALTGATAGGIIGGVVSGNPIIATISAIGGSVVGGLIIGTLSQKLSKSILDNYIEDDVKIFYRMLERQLFYSCQEFLLTKKEAKILIVKKLPRKISARFFKRVYRKRSIYERELYLKVKVEKIIFEILSLRRKYKFSFKNEKPFVYNPL